MTLLRLITCGSVDDGKSTLVGRLLFDSPALRSDERAALEEESRRQGGDRIDYSLLLDGLAAEREQGITIDVAYRYFASARRKFIVADTPGHEQYTRNMVTGASTADLAVILIDARKGVLTQTRRHAYLVNLLGIRSLVLAVNKMDLVGYAQPAFDAIHAEFRAFAEEIGAGEVVAIPMSARDGDNVTTASPNMLWYAGPTLLDHLETVAPAVAPLPDQPFRMPVQLVNRASDFRGLSGTVASGTIRPGDRLRVLPSGRPATVSRLIAAGRDAQIAVAREAVTLVLAEHVDCARGDMLAAADDPAEIADQFEATIVWMDDEPLLPGRSYWLKIGAITAAATVTDLKYQVNVNTLEHVAAKTLDLNGIGVANISLDRQIAFAPYAESRALGGFILIDRITNATAGAGMIHFALRRAQNVHWQHLEIDRAAHAALKRQQPRVIWFTGLSGAGKSAIANLVEKKLHAEGRHSFLLDGDNVRHGLNRDLGFTDADRVENIRRIGEVARLMADAGLIVLCAFISPFRAERRMVREMLPAGEFVEVFVDTPLVVAEERDVKGLYKKARRGELANFTGIDSPYEPPEQAEIRIDTTELSAEQAAELIFNWLSGEQKPPEAS